MQSSYLIENRHMAVKRCKHGLFMYNRNDAFIGRGLDVYGEWCDFEIQLLRLFIKPGNTVIEPGPTSAPMRWRLRTWSAPAASCMPSSRSARIS